MLGKRRVSFKHNFRNEQVENGGGHVYRSVKRERVANKSFEDIKAIEGKSLDDPRRGYLLTIDRFPRNWANWLARFLSGKEGPLIETREKRDKYVDDIKGGGGGGEFDQKFDRNAFSKIFEESNFSF